MNDRDRKEYCKQIKKLAETFTMTDIGEMIGANRTTITMRLRRPASVRGEHLRALNNLLDELSVNS